MADTEEYQNKEDTILKQLKKNAYNDLILAQSDTVCFQIVQELVTKELPNVCYLRAWDILNKKFQPITGAPKTRLRKKFTKCELDYFKWDPKDCITELEQFRGNLQNQK